MHVASKARRTHRRCDAPHTLACLVLPSCCVISAAAAAAVVVVVVVIVVVVVVIVVAVRHENPPGVYVLVLEGRPSKPINEYRYTRRATAVP